MAALAAVMNFTSLIVIAKNDLAHMVHRYPEPCGSMKLSFVDWFCQIRSCRLWLCQRAHGAVVNFQELCSWPLKVYQMFEKL